MKFRTSASLAASILLASTSIAHATVYFAFGSSGIEAGGGNMILYSGLTPTYIQAVVSHRDSLEFGALADFNGDGIPDIVSSNFELPFVNVTDGKTGNSIGGAALTNSYPPPGLGAQVAAGDVNGDGIPDIIAGPNSGEGDGSSSSIRVFNLAGTLLSSYPASGNAVASADFNHDGHSDIVTGGTVYDAVTGNPLFNFPDAGGYSLAAGDVDGDGIPDVAVGTTSGIINIYSGTDQHLIESFAPFPVGGFDDDISVGLADVNGDGRDDIIASVGGHISIFDGVTLFPLLSNFVPSNGDTSQGSIAIFVTPEPASFALLSLAALPLLRRREQNP